MENIKEEKGLCKIWVKKIKQRTFEQDLDGDNIIGVAREGGGGRGMWTTPLLPLRWWWLFFDTLNRLEMESLTPRNHSHFPFFMGYIHRKFQSDRTTIAPQEALAIQGNTLPWWRPLAKSQSGKLDCNKAKKWLLYSEHGKYKRGKRAMQDLGEED